MPDMVPTPMTRHSTRASRVKVGPRMAMPWDIFSLTSSYTQDTGSQSVMPQLHSLGSFVIHKYTMEERRVTCEFELRANLANAQALDRSISRRKKGRASLQGNEPNVNCLNTAI